MLRRYEYFEMVSRGRNAWYVFKPHVRGLFTYLCAPSFAPHKPPLSPVIPHFSSIHFNFFLVSRTCRFLAKLTTVDAYVTSIAWDGRARAGASSNVFACSCTDGTWRIFNLTGNTAREQKKIQAHSGAVISLKWSHDGNTIVTAGEDGDLKVWSPSGNLRSTLQSAAPVYNFCWGPDGDTILWCSGKALNLKSLSGSGPRKALSWQAHEETVLCLDWNRINELIVSAGEDCVYKVWDAYGRQLYVSPPTAHVITSISWCPNGECFAVGSFDSLRLCDRTGWSYSREQSDSGSFMQLAWTPDGA